MFFIGLISKVASKRPGSEEEVIYLLEHAGIDYLQQLAI